MSPGTTIRVHGGRVIHVVASHVRTVGYEQIRTACWLVYAGARLSAVREAQPLDLAKWPMCPKCERAEVTP